MQRLELTPLRGKTELLCCCLLFHHCFVCGLLLTRRSSAQARRPWLHFGTTHRLGPEETLPHDAQKGENAKFRLVGQLHDGIWRPRRSDGPT